MTILRAARAPPPQESPRLRIPLPDAERMLGEQIAKGKDLAPANNAIQSEEDLTNLRDKYYTWNDYNTTWPERNPGKTIAEEYSSRIAFGFIGGTPEPLHTKIRNLDEDLRMYLRRLESIRERLPLWADETESKSLSIGTGDGIFVVHGRDEGRAQHVARVLERRTGRDVTILHEQANSGRTLIEKFENHAQRAGFAVVILTGDDEGHLAGTGDLARRARQNVIFELGFFFGLLGREQVAILKEPEVEEPSDVDGLAYISLDAVGAWKQELARELEAGGIAVDRQRLP